MACASLRQFLRMCVDKTQLITLLLHFSMRVVGLNDTEMIQRQKAALNKKLGLDGPVSQDLNLFDDSDLVIPSSEAGIAGTSAVSTVQVTADPL